MEQRGRRGGAGQAGACSSPGDGSSNNSSSSNRSGDGDQVHSKGTRIRSLTPEQVKKACALNGYVGDAMDPGVVVGARAERGDVGGTMAADQLTAVQFLALAARSPNPGKHQLTDAMQQRLIQEEEQQLKSAKGKGGDDGGKGASLWLSRPAHSGV